MTSPAPGLFYEPRLAPMGESFPALPAARWRRGVLVRAPNWLGDSLMTLPAVAGLVRLRPADTALWILCPASLAPLWEAVHGVTAVIPLAGRHATGDVARRIRDLGAGVAVVFPNSLGSALDVTFKGIPVRVGRCGRGRSLLLSRTTAAWRRSERRARYHQATHYLDVAALLGPVRRTTDMPRFTLPGREAALERLGIAPAAAPWLALAPGAAYGPAKQWPVGNFRKLAESWAGAGRRVVIVGGPGDAAAGARIAEGLPHALSLCGKTTLAELMAVLSAARACVANDSGAMHLAAALGTPGVALFGSTNPEATGPLGARWIVLAEPTDCAPCFAHTCRRREQDYRCLTRISPERALAALASLAEA